MYGAISHKQETSIDVSLLYTIRSVQISPYSTEFSQFSAVRVRNVDRTVYLKAIPLDQFHNSMRAENSFGIALHLYESPDWLLEEVRPIIEPADATIFLIIALLALNHSIHLLEFVAHQIAFRTKCCCKNSVENSDDIHLLTGTLLEVPSNLNYSYFRGLHAKWGLGIATRSSIFMYNAGYVPPDII